MPLQILDLNPQKYLIIGICISLSAFLMFGITTPDDRKNTIYSVRNQHEKSDEYPMLEPFSAEPLPAFILEYYELPHIDQ